MVLVLLISNFLLIKIPREENRVGGKKYLLAVIGRNPRSDRDLCENEYQKRISDEYQTNI